MTLQNDRDGDTLETLVRGLNLLLAFSSGRPSMSIADAAEVLDVSRAAARRFLLTLESMGFLEREGREFKLTARVLDLGYAYLTSLDLPALAGPILRDVAGKTGETASLYILHEGDAIAIAGAKTQRRFSVMPSVGTALPAYASAVGRVLLSGLLPNELEEYIRTVEITTFTPHTVRNKKELIRSIQLAAQNGYAFAKHEMSFGMCGVAAPIFNSESKIVAAMSLGLQAGPDPDELLHSRLPFVKSAAHELSRILSKTSV